MRRLSVRPIFSSRCKALPVKTRHPGGQTQEFADAYNQLKDALKSTAPFAAQINAITTSLAQRTVESMIHSQSQLDSVASPPPELRALEALSSPPIPILPPEFATIASLHSMLKTYDDVNTNLAALCKAQKESEGTEEDSSTSSSSASSERKAALLQQREELRRAFVQDYDSKLSTTTLFNNLGKLQGSHITLQRLFSASRFHCHTLNGYLHSIVAQARCDA